MTQGYADGLKVIQNFNTLAQPLGFAFFSPDCGIPANPTTCFESVAFQDAYGTPYNGAVIKAHAVTTGMSNLYLNGWWPITGYPAANIASGPNPVALGSNYTVLATKSYTNHKSVVFPALNAMVAGTVGGGRVVAIGDEWVTSDPSLSDTTYGPSAAVFWNNALKWLGQCP